MTRPVRLTLSPACKCWNSPSRTTPISSFVNIERDAEHTPRKLHKLFKADARKAIDSGDPGGNVCDCAHLAQRQFRPERFARLVDSSECAIKRSLLCRLLNRTYSLALWFCPGLRLRLSFYFRFDFRFGYRLVLFFQKFVNAFFQRCEVIRDAPCHFFAIRGELDPILTQVRCVSRTGRGMSAEKVSLEQASLYRRALIGGQVGNVLHDRWRDQMPCQGLGRGPPLPCRSSLAIAV